jgi:hypothetical protein
LIEHIANVFNRAMLGDTRNAKGSEGHFCKLFELLDALRYYFFLLQKCVQFFKYFNF